MAQKVSVYCTHNVWIAGRKGVVRWKAEINKEESMKWYPIMSRKLNGIKETKENKNKLSYTFFAKSVLKKFYYFVEVIVSDF